MGIAEQTGRRAWIGSDANRNNRETPKGISVKPTEFSGLMEIVEAIADLRIRMGTAETSLARLQVTSVTSPSSTESTGGTSRVTSETSRVTRRALSAAERQARWRAKRKAGKLPE
jgi:hypothetical protein